MGQNMTANQEMCIGKTRCSSPEPWNTPKLGGHGDKVMRKGDREGSDHERKFNSFWDPQVKLRCLWRIGVQPSQMEYTFYTMYVIYILRSMA